MELSKKDKAKLVKAISLLEDVAANLSVDAPERKALVKIFQDIDETFDLDDED